MAAAITLGFGLLGALWLFGRALALFVLATTLASALWPLASRLAGHVRYSVAVIFVYLALFAVIGVVGVYAIPAITEDTSTLGQQLPELVDRLRRAVTGVPIGGDTLIRAMQNLVPRVLSVSSQLATAAVDILVVVFLSLYLLMTAPGSRDYLAQLLPASQRRRTLRLLGKMSHEMGGYFRGAALNGTAVAALTWVVLQVIGLPYSGPLAVLAFLGELVPYIGPVVVAIPAIGVALLQSTGTAVTVAIAYIAIQQIEGHVLTPLIMHSQTHISPALVIIALTMGYSIGGIVGALAAIPIFAGTRVVVRHVVAPELRRRAHASRRPRPTSPAAP